MGIQSLTETWRNDPYYGHGFITCVIALFFFALALLKNRSVKIQAPNKKQWLFASIFFCAIVVFQTLAHFSGGMLGSFLQVINVLLAIKLVTLLFWNEGSQHFNFPLLFFVFAVPLPYLDNILFQLQFSTAWFVTAFLSVIGVDVIREGLLISLPDWKFVVGSSCSGFNGCVVLMSLIFLLTKILGWPGKKQFFLLILVFPIAFIANVVRILFLVFVGEWKGSESAFEYWHDSGALTFYVLALIGVTCVTYKLNSRMQHDKTPV